MHVNLCGLRTRWRLWGDTPEGLSEGRTMDTVEGDGQAVTAAKQWDLFIPPVFTQSNIARSRLHHWS